MEGPIRFGRVSGFRGNAGEMTVRVVSGEAARWIGIRSVRVAATGSAAGGAETRYSVERARAYGDRLVLKLEGVDGPGEADALRGAWLEAPPEEVPPLPEGTYFVGRLIGLRAVDELEGTLGIIEDVMETGSVELLQVRADDGSEVLVPFAREIVTGVDVEAGEVRLKVPEGLVGLNRPREARR